MARQTNGIDQSLQSAASLDLTAYNQLTVAFWLYWDVFADTDNLAAEFSVNATSNNAFYIDPNASTAGGGKFGIDMNDTVGGGELALFTRPTAAAWHHYAITFDRTLVVTPPITHVYMDSSDQTLSNTSNVVSTNPFGNYVFYLMARANTSLWGAGRIAEVALYPGLLFSQTDVNNLYNSGAGQDARNVQGGSLAYYWQLCGTASPEPALVGGINMTVNGATQVAHPISGSGICGAGAATPTGAFSQTILRSRVREW